jgi:hypothetical protein
MGDIFKKQQDFSYGADLVNHGAEEEPQMTFSVVLVDASVLGHDRRFRFDAMLEFVDNPGFCQRLDFEQVNGCGVWTGGPWNELLHFAV